MSPLEFVPERDHQRITESIERVIGNGEIETIEAAIVTKDGSEIPYEVTDAPPYQGGEIVGETGVGRDISERKRREEQLGRLDELNTVIRSVDQDGRDSACWLTFSYEGCRVYVDEDTVRVANLELDVAE